MITINSIDEKNKKITTSDSPRLKIRTDLDKFVVKFNSGKYVIIQGFVQSDVPAITLGFFGGTAAMATLKSKGIDQGEAKKEYERQLGKAEARLKKMSVGRWESNRNSFINLGKPSSESSVRSKYRERFARKLATLYKIKAASGDNPISDSEALADAKLRMTGRAALHLDQVLGGNPEEILGLGIDTINTSIGSTTSHKISQVDDAYFPFIAKLNQKEKNTLLMNVSLEYKGPAQ